MILDLSIINRDNIENYLNFGTNLMILTVFIDLWELLVGFLNMKVKEITKRGVNWGFQNSFSITHTTDSNQGKVEIEKKSLTQRIYTGSV